jgi:hypothetical protein
MCSKHVNTVKPVLKGHLCDNEKWPFKTGGLQRWPFNTGLTVFTCFEHIFVIIKLVACE